MSTKEGFASASAAIEAFASHAAVLGDAKHSQQYGPVSPVCHVAPFATRYLHDYGVRREQLAWIPLVSCRSTRGEDNRRAVDCTPRSVTRSRR